MSWLNFIENPKTVLGYFDEAPSIESVTAHSLVLRRDGPVAALVFDLIQYPSRPSPRWPEGSNTCQITIDAIGLESVKLSAWGTGVVGRIEIERIDQNVRLSFSGDATFQITCACLRIACVMGYLNGQA